MAWSDFTERTRQADAIWQPGRLDQYGNPARGPDPADPGST